MDKLIAARMPKELIASIEKWASEHDVDRSEAIRRLVEMGLGLKGF